MTIFGLCVHGARDGFRGGGPCSGAGGHDVSGMWGWLLRETHGRSRGEFIASGRRRGPKSGSRKDEASMRQIREQFFREPSEAGPRQAKLAGWAEDGTRHARGS